MEDTVPAQGDKMMKKGVIGSLVAAVCCFTPALVFLFAGVGLSGLIGGLDYVLFPLLFASLGVTAYAFYLRSGNKGMSPKTIIAVLALTFSALLIWLEFKYALRISLLAVALVAIYGFYLRPSKSQVVS